MYSSIDTFGRQPKFYEHSDKEKINCHCYRLSTQHKYLINTKQLSLNLNACQYFLFIQNLLLLNQKECS